MTEQVVAQTSEKSTEKVVGIEVIKLMKPLTIDGKKQDALTLNFTQLTGNDMEAIEAAITAEGKTTGVLAEISKTYLLHVCARAAGVNIEYLRQASLKDVSQMTALAQGFLLG